MSEHGAGAAATDQSHVRRVNYVTVISVVLLWLFLIAQFVFTYQLNSAVGELSASVGAFSKSVDGLTGAVERLDGSIQRLDGTMTEISNSLQGAVKRLEHIEKEIDKKYVPQN